MTNNYQPKYRWRETCPGEGKQDLTGRPIRLDTTTDGTIGMWQ
jgi:hypothetical protein